MQIEPILPESLLDLLSNQGTVRRFPARALLMNEDDRSQVMYVIVSGRIKVFSIAADGREVVYGTQGPGEIFGEMSLDGGPRSASVITLEPTVCQVIAGARMRRLLAEHPPLNQYLLNKLIGMVRSNTANVKSLALGDVHQRVVRLLSSLEGTSVGGRRVLYERMTHREIAERIGCSREMVSRVIKQLEREGHIITGNRRFVILRALPTDW